MPNKTERKRILEELERTILIEQATGADSDVEMRETRLLVDNDPDNCEEGDEEDFLCEAFEDSEDDLLEQVYVQVASSRYLNRGSTIARAPQRLDWLLNELDDYRFKQEVRMTRGCFHQLVELIRRHSIYMTKKAPQRPVELQLLVALKRFGYFGNGASIGMVARHFAISGISNLFVISFVSLLLVYFNY